MDKLIFFTLGFCLHCSINWAQVPEWQHIPGPDGGRVENFDLDGLTLYALSHSAIYRSEDEGYHWQLLPKSLGTTRDKRQLRVEKGVFYALSDEGSLVRSIDQGASWKPVLQKPFPFDFETEQLQHLFVKGDTLLVGSLFTIYRSVNRGETWTTTADLVPASFVSIFEFKNEIFAAQDRYIYRSSDGGMSWESVFANAVGYAAVVATDSFLLAFYAPKNRLIRSTDGLRTWDAIDTDTLANHLEEDPYGAYPFRCVVGAGNLLYYYQTGHSHYFCPVRFCYSMDGGSTWRRGNHGAQVPIGRYLNDGISFGNHIVLASNQIQHSVDSGQTFSIQQVGLKAPRIDQVIHHGNTLFSTTVIENQNRSTNQGESWDAFQFPNYLGSHCQPSVWFEKTDKRLFRIAETEHLYEFSYTEDGGQNWKTLAPQDLYPRAVTKNAVYLRERSWTPNGPVNKFLKLTDHDTAFIELTLIGFDINQFPYYNLISLYDRFAIEYDNEFFIFDEYGTLNRQLPTSPCSYSVFSAPGNLYFLNDTYYNFCDDRCYILKPNTSDWQEIYPQDWTMGAPLYHNRRTFFLTHEGLIWVGLEGKGLFYATDNTGRFYPAQPQMPYPYPTAVSFHENQIWVGTDGGGIWTYPLPKKISDSTQKPVFQVFPNPSEGELNLQTDQFIKEEIAFAVFDAAGRRIVKNVLSPGQYWNPDLPDLPKGMYFLQMRTESGVFGLKWVVGN